MKKTILIFVCSLLIFTVAAQTNYSPVGTWRYTNGSDTIDIYLKADQLTLDRVTYSILIGFHRYVKNGVLVESTMEYANTSYTDKKYSISTFDNSIVKSRIDGHIKDVTLNNERYIIFTKINPTTMNVKLNYIQGVRNNRPSGFTMPRSFQLTKL